MGTRAGGDGVASIGSTRPGAQHPPRAMRPSFEASQDGSHSVEGAEVTHQCRACVPITSTDGHYSDGRAKGVLGWL